MSAEAVIRDALLSALPPGVPPSFVEIHDARFEGSGRRRVAVARLTMFDGLAATVRVSTLGLCTRHSYPTWEGEALFWDGTQWRRESAAAPSPLPETQGA